MGLTKIGTQFFHSNFSRFHKCILGTEHISDNNPILLIPDSICPLGIQVVNELERRNVNFLDIRGQAHLDINTQPGHEILKEYNIQKVLMVCDTNQARSFYKENRNFTFLSAIPDLPGDSNFITKYPIFGHLRGKRINTQPFNLFFDCINHSINNSINQSQWILATDVAPIIASNINTKKDIKIKVPVYTSTYLHSLFYSHCINNISSPLVEKQLESCHPYPPIGKNITLSIVGELSDDSVYYERVNAVSLYYDHYLSFYRTLPFEFILLFVHTKPEQVNPFDVLKFGPTFQKYVRIIEITFNKYQKILKHFKPTDFPEYIVKNIGIRRARGEYIIAVSPDSFPNKRLFDMILHHQFTPHTLERGFRMDIDLKDFHSSIAVMDLEKYNKKQYFADHRNFSNILDMVLCAGGGDYQGGHWTAWKNVKGYIEGDFVYHTDTFLSLEFISQQPNLLLIKPIGNTYHYIHPDQSDSKLAIPFNYQELKSIVDQSILSCDSDSLQRDYWGFPYDQEFPRVVF